MGTMRNEAVVALRYCSSHLSEVNEENMKIQSKDTRCHGLDSKLTPPEYTSRVVPVQPSVRFLKMETEGNKTKQKGKLRIIHRAKPCVVK